jgi:hypothetical protein
MQLLLRSMQGQQRRWQRRRRCRCLATAAATVVTSPPTTTTTPGSVTWRQPQQHATARRRFAATAAAANDNNNNNNSNNNYNNKKGPRSKRVPPRTGRIVADHGRRLKVLLLSDNRDPATQAHNEKHKSVTIDAINRIKGETRDDERLVCGDYVLLRGQTDDGTNDVGRASSASVIFQRLPRCSEVRRGHKRGKAQHSVLVANVDHVGIVVAPRPKINYTVLDMTYGCGPDRKEIYLRLQTFIFSRRTLLLTTCQKANCQTPLMD